MRRCALSLESNREGTRPGIHSETRVFTAKR